MAHLHEGGRKLERLRACCPCFNCVGPPPAGVCASVAGCYLPATGEPRERARGLSPKSQGRSHTFAHADACLQGPSGGGGCQDENVGVIGCKQAYMEMCPTCQL